MTEHDNTIRRSTLLWLLLAINTVYFGTGWTFGPRVAIELLNVLLLAAASGTAVAYLHDARMALGKRLLSGADVLAVGIFLGWGATTVARGGSVLWRLYDKPVEWLDSLLWGGHIAGSTMAAMCHLLSPRGVGGRIPTWQWIKIGLWTAAAVGAAGALLALNVD